MVLRANDAKSSFSWCVRFVEFANSASGKRENFLTKNKPFLGLPDLLCPEKDDINKQ